MAQERVQRRLAAILAADVVGYSRLMQADEAGTLTSLKATRTEILQPLITTHRGRIVKVMGDGVLMEFASAVNAVSCAAELQEAMHTANRDVPEDRRIMLRVGITLGDVMVEGSDLYGDGVNIAARIEGLTDPGGVFVSETVFNHVRGKVSLKFEDLGERRLKNIAEPIRVYRVRPGGEAVITMAPTSTVPNKSAVAVMPFTNMSGDPEQEYFSDGITEDIITDLSQVSALFVAARHSAFTFKGKAVEIVQAARTLNVRYILEGSVRKAGNRIRITAQLIDCATGGHVWAERYDRDLGDIFALQDDISKEVVAALKVKLLPAEMNAITGRSTTNAAAYEYYLHGRSHLAGGWGNKELLELARQMFSKATEIDAGYARAYAGIAECDASLWIIGEIAVSHDDILANSTKALSLAPNLAEAHACKGFALYWTGHPDEATASFERAIELDSELYEVQFYYGMACRDTGRYDKAAGLLERAAELRTTDYIALSILADVYASLGFREQCVSAAKRSMARIEAALAKHLDEPAILAWGAATIVYLGENTRAEEWAKRATTLSPDDPVVRYLAACAYSLIGRADAALECLEFIFLHFPRMRRYLLGLVNHDSQMDPLRGCADFRAFVKRLETDAADHS